MVSYLLRSNIICILNLTSGIIFISCQERIFKAGHLTYIVESNDPNLRVADSEFLCQWNWKSKTSHVLLSALGFLQVLAAHL